MNLEVGTNSGSVLGRIVEARRASIAHRQRVLPEPVLRMAVKSAKPPRDFAGALTRAGVNIISGIEKSVAIEGIVARGFSSD